jgi:hypothetical protein
MFHNLHCDDKRGAQQSNTILLALTTNNPVNQKLTQNAYYSFHLCVQSMACREAEAKDFVYSTCGLFHLLLTSETLLTEKRVWL